MFALLVLENTANLLQLDVYQLNDTLTQKSMILRGEEILSPLTVEQAENSRDSAAMSLYSALFKYLLKMINKSIKGKSDFLFVGVLDIFGFENFKVSFVFIVGLVVSTVSSGCLVVLYLSYYVALYLIMLYYIILYYIILYYIILYYIILYYIILYSFLL